VRFVYQYRTQNNELRQDEVSAKDRETAFKVLRSQGIRPARLEEAPGFFNKFFGKGKRWALIGILAFFVLLLIIQNVRNRELIIQDVRNRESRASQAEVRYQQEQLAPRHQLYGDPAFLIDLERNDYAKVFTLPGERKLARFAQPGVVPIIGNKEWRVVFAKELSHVLTNEIIFVENERREVRELKEMVNWMKGELRCYLSNGNGTTESYVRRLIERQEKEHNIYIRAQKKLENEVDSAEYERVNAGLRAVGLRTIPIPMTIQE
jgi:heme exporter protein D